MSAVALLAVFLLSTACGADTTDESAGASPSSAGDSSADPAPGDSSPDATDDAAEDDSSSEVLAGAKCLPGNWYLDNKRFAKLMSTTGAVDDITGSVMLTLTADGRTKTHYDDWAHKIKVHSATVTMVKNGVDSGEYRVTENGTMSITEVKTTSKTTSKMDINGTMVTRAATPQPSLFSQATFTCSGDELTFTANGRSALMHREH